VDPRHDELADRLPVIYESLARRLDSPQERILLHHEEFGDRLLGVLAGYLLYARLVTEGPHAVVVIEKITGRQLGSVARQIVAVTVAEGIVESPVVPTNTHKTNSKKSETKKPDTAKQATPRGRARS